MSLVLVMKLFVSKIKVCLMMSDGKSIKNKIFSAISSVGNKLNPDADDLNEVIAENPKKALKLLFFPTFFTLFCLTLNGLVDSIFVAECGSSSLIGVGIIQSIFVIIVGIGTGLSVATNSALSYVLSKHSSMRAGREIIDNTIILTLIIGIVSSVILVTFLKPILIALNIGDALEPALIYGTILFGGNIFFFTAAVIPAILKAEGEVIKSTYSLISTSLLNVVLDYILIHELGLGVLGAGFATTFCSALCCAMLIYFMSKSKNISVSLSNFISNANFGIMKNLFIDSIPVSFEAGILSLFSFFANMLFNVFTTPLELAGFVAAYKVYCMAIIPIIALAESNVTIVAYLYAKRSFEQMKTLLKYELKISLLISFILWFLITVFRDFISYLYLLPASQAGLDIMSTALILLNIILIIMPLGHLSVSLLQGTQSYKTSFIVSSVRSVLLEIFLGFIFVQLFGNALGIYLGFIIGALLGCILSYIITNSIIAKKSKGMDDGGSYA